MARTSFAFKKDEDLTLRVFIGKNLGEVFASDRQAMAHRHIRETPGLDSRHHPHTPHND